MNKLWILVGQVFNQKVKAKSFLFITAIYILILSVVLFWPEISSFFSKDDKRNVAIVNETAIEMQPLFSSSESIHFSFPKDNKDHLYNQVKKGKLDAVIELSDDKEKLKANIVTYNTLTLKDQTTLSSLIEYAGKIYAIKQLKLTDVEANKILNAQSIITMTSLDEKTNGKSEEEKQSGIWASYIVGMIIYFFVTTYLSMITTDVASEKGSRTLEMILVNVKPSTHFNAKIIGVLLVALTQIVAVISAFFIILFASGKQSKLNLISDVVDELSLSFFLYVLFFLGFTLILYLIIGALLGSLVSKVEEASQTLTPAMLMTLLGFYVMLTGMANPDTLLISVFSHIPFTSGMVMPMRIGATDISVIEPIISLTILFLTVLFAYLFSLSFYKRSVLTYSSGGVLQKIKSVLKITT